MADDDASDGIAAYRTYVIMAGGLIVAFILWQIFKKCIFRFPCLQSCLLAMEVNSEVAAMNQSVLFAVRERTEDRSAIEAALHGATPGGPPIGDLVAANRRQSRTHDLMSRERPSARAPATASMGANTQALLLSEAKAETSKADDARKANSRLAPAHAPVAASPARAPSARKPRSGSPTGRSGSPTARKSPPKKGKATMVYPGDGVYEGAYVDGKKEGFGKFWYVEGTVYEGAWQADEKHGNGKETYADGAVYEGAFAHGSRSGFGLLRYANKDIYEGQWLDDIKHGVGTFRWAAGTVYEGEFADGVMHGEGTYHFADGCTYQGQYEDGKRNGRGVYRFLDGSFFEGEYVDGVVDGRGTFTFADGTAEVGRWEEGRPVGEATRFSPDHRTAWRLFDGVVTGPVSLDLADVIAQMAFRPKAARLARAVRDQLALVHLEDEPLRFTPPTQAPLSDAVPYYRNSSSPIPIHERPPWQGPRDASKRSVSPTGSLGTPSPPSSPEAAALPPPAVYPTCNTPGFREEAAVLRGTSVAADAPSSRAPGMSSRAAAGVMRMMQYGRGAAGGSAGTTQSSGAYMC